MSESAFRKLWTLIAIFVLGLTVTLFLRTTGLPLLIPFPVLATASPHATAVLGFPVALAANAATLVMAWLFARNKPRLGVGHRIPIPYFDPKDFDPSSAGGVLGAKITNTAFVVLPVLLLVPLFLKIVDGSVTLGIPAPATSSDVHFWGWGHFFPSLSGHSIDWSRWWKGEYRLDGPTFYPLVLPWFYLVSLFAMLMGLMRYQFVLFDGSDCHPPGTRSKGPDPKKPAEHRENSRTTKPGP